MLILGIETSCDETSASVVKDGKEILSNIIFSQEVLHRQYGGVVPELACRAHLESILGVINGAIAEAKVTLADINAVAVVNTPGLIGSLLIGITAAKSLCLALDVPLITINHLFAHIYANNLESDAIQYPAISMVVSGGHTSLFLSESPTRHTQLGGTIDDAAGEAFDKIAKILDLGYPGGPIVDKVAKLGNPSAVAFPRSFLGVDSLDFSFSGLKTAVLYHHRGQDVKKTPAKVSSEREIADVAASFQEAVVDVLVAKIALAARIYPARCVMVGGGVASNSRLRQRLKDKSAEMGIPAYFPTSRLCTDNAAMVAGLAYVKYSEGDVSGLNIEAIP